MKNIISVLFVIVIAAGVSSGEATSQLESKSGESGQGKNILKISTNNVRTITSTGFGKTRQGAIRQALLRAVEVTRGVAVQSNVQELEFEGVAAEFEDREPNGSEINFGAVDIRSSGTVEGFGVNGLIKTYEIIEETQDEAGTYLIKIEAQVYDREDGEREKVRIALVPVKCSEVQYSFFDKVLTAEEVCRLFTGYLATELVNSGEYEVLDRENVREFAKEENLLINLNAPLEERAKFAESFGADYMLITEIIQANIAKEEVYLEAAEHKFSKYKARLALNYRLVDCTTKEIAFSSQVSEYLKNDEIRKFADEYDDDEWDSVQIMRAYLQDVAKKQVRDMITRCNPIKVAKVDGDLVTVNAGKGSVSENAVLEVYTEGDDVYDPDSGESIGRSEATVATLRVEKVLQEMSITRIIDKQEEIKTGMLCRVKEAGRSEHKGLKPDIERKEGGGVKLPFDK